MFGLLMVFLGGGIGAGLRYVFAHFASNFGLSYQSTFLINIIGSMFLGFVAYIAIKKEDKFDPDLKLFLTTGIAGGFTTFSTFCNEVFKLMQTNQIIIGYWYLFLSVTVGLFATVLGTFIARQFLLWTYENKLVNNAEFSNE